MWEILIWIEKRKYMKTNPARPTDIKSERALKKIS